MENLKPFEEPNAWVLIRMAIEHGALKMHGPGGDKVISKERAEVDAVYLRTLYTLLSDPTMKS